MSIKKTIMTAVLILLLLCCFACRNNPLNPDHASKWQVVKEFDIATTVTTLFVKNSNIWAFIEKVDLSNPQLPVSKVILLKSNDGGKSFFKNNAPNIYIINLFFASASHGWLIDKDGILYQTENGGSSWERVKFIISDDRVYSVYFNNSLEGWLGGKPNFKTIDGGKTWIRKHYPNNLSINAHVHYIDEKKAFAKGSSDLKSSSGLYETIDGGDSWTLVYHPIDHYINSFDTINGINIWYIDGKNLYQSNDSGKNWKIQRYDIEGQVLRFFDTNHAVIAGNDGIWRTNDGGIQWSKELSGLPDKVQGQAKFFIAAQNEIWGWGQHVIFKLKE